MPKFWRLLAMNYARLMQYRADLFLWMVVENASPLVSLAIWYTIAKTNSHGPTPTETVTYYILMMFIVLITNSWGGFFLSREILSGEIVKYLIRPMSVFPAYVSDNFAEKTIKLIIPIPLLLLAVFAFPQFFSPAIYALNHVAWFIVSLMLAFILNFLIDMNFGVLAFWLEDVMQIRRYNDLLYQATSGILIPFRFLPAWALTVFSFLPFRYIYSTPAEIILGWTNPLTLITRQIIWIALTLTLLTVLWKRGLQRYAPPGQ